RRRRQRGRGGAGSGLRGRVRAAARRGSMIEGVTTPSTAGWWLASFLVALTAQRFGEFVISARNEKRLRSLGAREHARGHFPLLLLVHVLFPVCLVAEFLLLGVRPGRLWPLWLALCVVAQALRLASIRALGERWHVRIWVVPGMPLVRHGPYRWLRHPNYLAVVIELVAAPLMFGAWRTAAGISALNLVALGIRIRAEQRALGSSATA
ncbi:MAG TPA: isoprenylcysteine carboxylmethyltransferase family protein, partial [Dongiaceae bacterium]|nr:isoprenylcysteine carboxylmethyltransferase family protein [Dongiaceae bacterium]